MENSYVIAWNKILIYLKKKTYGDIEMEGVITPYTNDHSNTKTEERDVGWALVGGWGESSRLS